MTAFTIKLLGAVSIATAVIFIIWLKIKEKKKSLSFVTDFISSLKYIEDLIFFRAVPFSEVLEKTVEAANESRSFFQKVLDGIKSEDNPTLNEVWLDAISLFAGENHLLPKTVEIIKRLGSRLGTMSIEIETENLAIAQRELLGEKQKLLTEFEKEAKLLKSLGFAFGGFIILIFI